ncbi:MAG: SWF/SNF helicase family protein, partial [Alphaproteobacteria bacterium]|nr:SWF/SNF helicase family protein [Alphaproteobacteria bacterium]
AGEWDEDRAFPKHESAEHSYRLSKPYMDFQEAVLDYCLNVVSRAGAGQREQRLAFWGTLALMRCVGSSPAAAVSALRNRMAADSDRLEPQIFDDDGNDEDAVDIEPAAAFDADPKLLALVKRAEELKDKADPKLKALIDVLAPIIKKGANPVVFCRYLATADHVREGLRSAFPKLVVESVTGVLTPDERRDRVSEMGQAAKDKDLQRILVATDCLSEGINLQQLFDTVVHYDLCWNPTRHQQREGRVDRFGQPAELVRSIMMYSPDSAIDGAVLDVVLRKANEIREATGVTVPLPEDKGPVTAALMAAVMLRGGVPVKPENSQLALGLSLEDGTRFMETTWRDASENEKKSRARFAQHAMKPQQVAPEWAKVRALLGSPEDARQFVERAMGRFGVPLESRKSALLAHVEALEPGLRDRLHEHDLKGSLRLASTEPAPSGTALLTRTHPLTATLAEALVEASLDREAFTALGIGRVGAWPTTAVQKVTSLVLLRMRFKLIIHARRERLLLAEEAALVAIEGGKVVAMGEAARVLLNAPATSDFAPVARDRFIGKAREGLPGLLQGPIADFARSRAGELMDDHGRLRVASGASRVTVEAVLPPDVIGLFVLMPGEA